MSWDGLEDEVREMFARLEGVPETSCRLFRSRMHVARSGFNETRRAERAQRRDVRDESVGRIVDLIRVYGSAAVLAAFRGAA